MLSYYQLIRKACYEFTAKNHYAPSVIYMNEDIYGYLFHEMFCDEWWVLMHCRRIQGLKIIFDNTERSFHLE